MSKKNSKTTKSEPETSIYKEYFQYTNQHQLQYGEKTVVLLQVGAFFEVYGMKNKTNDLITGSIISEFADVCQLNVSEKKIDYNNQHIVMAGFRDFTIDKYLAKLTDYGYTVAVYVQEKNGKEVSRKLNKVYSAGTYISCDTDSSPVITNNIMCIWFDVYKPFSTTTNNGLAKTKETIVYGVSVVNIFTGKSSIFQHETPFLMSATTFDELERFISIFSPSEVIILSAFDNKKLSLIKQFVGIQSNSIHEINTTDLMNTKVLNCSNQKYLKQILSNLFGEESYNICNEFQLHNIATQSFCYLLDFIKEHNPDLIRKISIPEFDNTSYRMILANHTLSQLNIISDSSFDSKRNGQLSCVISFLNKCLSPMGKRKFQYQLTNPTFDEEWLKTEYAMTSIMLVDDNYHFIEMFRKQLLKIRDIEKICRQLVLKKVYPSSISYLYNSIQSIKQINECLAESNIIQDYLCSDFLDNSYCLSSYQHIKQNSEKFIEFLDKHFYIEFCKITSSMNNFDENIIKPGISEKLDYIIAKYNENNELFYSIKNYFNKLIQDHEKSAETDYIKVHETDKSGLSLQITAKRSQTMKIILNNLINSGTDGVVILPNGNHKLNLKDVKFTKASTSNMEIDCSIITKLCNELFILKESMNNEIANTYLTILSKIEEQWYNCLENFAIYTSKIDILQCKSYIARTYNYCQPEIVSETSKSFVNASDLRHCLIEHIQQNELYVTNDISLGENSDCDGILLYGTNAVGKTSLIRALGISVIMAQSGLYVPCSKFVYKPYTAIFSRILGNDNLFKGLSTFAVEMSELRTILKMSDENSLILGDELCSGTETESALSIFVAGLMNLHSKNSSYIFATHFHEIIHYDEIMSLHRLKMKHMSISYDREKDCLVYDRKLKEGSGPRIYGLEVCKSLYLGDEFLESAYAIRNKYYPETRGELSNKPTTYNSNKIKGMCEICGVNIGEEIHHLKHQKNADKNGFIGTHHKNHVANLITVCEACHDNFHSEQNDEFIRKKTTIGYKLEKS